jgi:hypothetical protein
MTREQKIVAIKAAAKGDFTELKALRKKQDLADIQDKYFLPMFHYIVKNGRIFFEKYHGSDPLLKQADLDTLIDGLNKIDRDSPKDLSTVPLRALLIMAEILGSLELLYNNDQLHLLDPYLEA